MLATLDPEYDRSAASGIGLIASLARGHLSAAVMQHHKHVSPRGVSERRENDLESLEFFPKQP